LSGHSPDATSFAEISCGIINGFASSRLKQQPVALRNELQIRAVRGIITKTKKHLISP